MNDRMPDYVPEDSPLYKKAQVMAQGRRGGFRDYIPEGEVPEEKTVPNSCPECGWRGKDQVGVDNHLQRQHPNAYDRKKTREREAAEAENEPQDRKRYQRRESLGGPESLAEEVRYLCPICNHRAKNRVNLINHLEFEHKEEEERLAEEGKASGEKGLNLRSEADPDPRIMKAAARQGALPGQDGLPSSETEAAEFLSAEEAQDEQPHQAEDGEGPKIEGDTIPQEVAEKPLDGVPASAGVTEPDPAGKPEAANSEPADNEISVSDNGNADDSEAQGKRRKVSK